MFLLLVYYNNTRWCLEMGPHSGLWSCGRESYKVYLGGICRVTSTLCLNNKPYIAKFTSTRGNHRVCDLWLHLPSLCKVTRRSTRSWRIGEVQGYWAGILLDNLCVCWEGYESIINENMSFIFGPSGDSANAVPPTNKNEVSNDHSAKNSFFTKVISIYPLFNFSAVIFLMWR